MLILLAALASSPIIPGGGRPPDPAPLNMQASDGMSESPSEREFTTDRPDITDNPYTIDSGRLQIELSAAEYTLERDRTRTIDVMPVSIQYGLSSNVDVQLLFTPYQRWVEGAGVDREVSRGFGDETLLRLKINLQGNDHEGLALGVIPYVKLPTGTGSLSNHHVEGGLVVPVAIDLAEDVTLGGMIEADLVYRDETGEYGLDLIHSIALEHPVAGPISAYVEYVGTIPSNAPAGRASHYQALGSAGLMFEVQDDLALDVGARIGFSGDADRAALFVGASKRF
jgi:Putative MetA-pathway of phenol degradation